MIIGKSCYKEVIEKLNDLDPGLLDQFAFIDLQEIVDEILDGVLDLTR